MLTPKVLPTEIVNLLLPRLKDELTAFHFYKNARNWCANQGYEVASKYFEAEYNDELSHAKVLEDFLNDWNVYFDVPQIDKNPLKFKVLSDIIEQAYKMEYALYEDYEDTSAKIFKLGDICAFDMLKFHRDVQTKSVAEYATMINKLTGVDVNNKFNMLLLEKKLF